MSDENDWSISFNPGTDDYVDTKSLLEDMKPLVAEINKTGHRRYEIIIDESNGDVANMGEAMSQVIARLGEIMPSSYITGHIEDDELTDEELSELEENGLL